MSLYRNAEGYYDPTAGEALSNFAKEERRTKKPGQRQYKKPDTDLGNPYHALANAIIVQAVDDYREALRIRKRNPNSQRAKAAIDEIEHFFRSEWFTFLTSVNGEMLIRKLREESK